MSFPRQSVGLFVFSVGKRFGSVLSSSSHDTHIHISRLEICKGFKKRNDPYSYAMRENIQEAPAFSRKLKKPAPTLVEES